MSKALAESPDVGSVFNNVVARTQTMLDGQDVDMAVDLKLNFTSISITKTGLPVIWGKREESVLEISFATRVISHRTPK